MCFQQEAHFIMLPRELHENLLKKRTRQRDGGGPVRGGD